MTYLSSSLPKLWSRKVTTIIGALIIAVSLILFFVQINYRTHLQNIEQARATTALELQQVLAKSGNINLQDYIDYEYVKLHGRIRCQPPLISELAKEPCVYYQMSIVSKELPKVAIYRNTKSISIFDEDDKDKISKNKIKRDKNRNRTHQLSKTIAQNSRSIPFLLEDSSGTVLVNPDAGEIETVKILDEFRQEPSGIYDGNQYTESILPCDREVLILGEVTAVGNEITINKPLKFGNRLIISLKSEEEFTKSTRFIVNSLLYGAIACLTIGAVMLFLGFEKAQLSSLT